MITASKWYKGLKVAGVKLCRYPSYWITFYPFVMLESVWMPAASVSFVKRVSRETYIK